MQRIVLHYTLYILLTCNDGCPVSLSLFRFHLRARIIWILFPVKRNKVLPSYLLCVRTQRNQTLYSIMCFEETHKMIHQAGAWFLKRKNLNTHVAVMLGCVNSRWGNLWHSFKSSELEPVCSNVWGVITLQCKVFLFQWRRYTFFQILYVQVKLRGHRLVMLRQDV